MGRGRVRPRRSFPNPTAGDLPSTWSRSSYINPVRAGYSFDITDLLNYISTTATPQLRHFVPARRGRRQLQRVRSLPRRPHWRGRRLGLLRRRRRASAARRADAAVRDPGRHQRHRSRAAVERTPSSGSAATWPRPDLGADNFGRVQFSSYFRPAGDAGRDQRQLHRRPTVHRRHDSRGDLLSIESPPSPDPFYTGGPNPINPVGIAPQPGRVGIPELPARRDQ